MTKMIRCPLCRKETSWEDNPFKPFCSERCKTRDLGNWASGRYAVPGEKVSTSERFDEEESSEPLKEE